MEGKCPVRAGLYRTARLPEQTSIAPKMRCYTRMDSSYGASLFGSLRNLVGSKVRANNPPEGRYRRSHVKSIRWLIYRPENYDPAVSEDEATGREIEALNDEMKAAGVRICWRPSIGKQPEVAAVAARR
jgi:hypothetical protein